MYPSGDSVSGVRLVGGSNSSEGRVEIRVNGRWESICATNFSTDDARVICRVLGYAKARKTSQPNDFGTGGYPPLLTLGCTGVEKSIEECPISCSSCLPSASAGVKCYGQWLVHVYIVIVLLLIVLKIFKWLGIDMALLLKLH